MNHHSRLVVMVCFLGILMSCEAPFAFPPKVDPNSKPLVGPPTIVEPVPVVGSSNLATIVPSRINGVAPLAVHFDATGSTSTKTAYPYRDIRYTWDFGDSAAAAQTWPTGARSGTLSKISKNEDSGPVAAHVFENTGDYTVRVTCYDGVSTFSTTVDIHVADPALYYQGAKTIYVSSSGVPVPGANGVPSDADSNQCFQLSDFNVALTKFTANDQRVALCRGDTFTLSNTVFLANYTGLTIDAYGTAPAKPMVVFQSTKLNYGISPAADDLRIMNLQFSTIQGLTNTTFTSRMATTVKKHQLLLNLDGQGISSIAQFGGLYNFAVNCTLNQAKGGGGNVGLWYAVMGTGGALLGNRIVDCTGIEHNIRTHAASKSVIAHNDLAIPAPSKHLLTVRGVDNAKNGLPGIEWTELVLVSDNQFGSATEAGGSLQVAPEATGFNEPIRNVIIEKNLFSGPTTAASGVTLDTGPGLVFRNNIALIKGGSIGGFNFMSINHSNLAGSPTASDAWIVNNTLYTDIVGNFSFIQAAHNQLPDPHDIHFHNNLAYVPFGVKNSAGNGSADMASLFSITFIESNNTSIAQLKGTDPDWLSSPAAPASLDDLGLKTTSYGHNGGSTTPVPVLDDFFGATRTGLMDMGAFNLDP